METDVKAPFFLLSEGRDMLDTYQLRDIRPDIEPFGTAGDVICQPVKSLKELHAFIACRT